MEKSSTPSTAGLYDRLNAGMTKAQVARELGISRETVYQYLRGA